MTKRSEWIERLRHPAKLLLRRWRRIRDRFVVAWLRAQGCKVDWTASIHPSSVIERSGGTIAIGKNSVIDRAVIIRAMGGAITVGDDCNINAYSFLSGAGGLKVGNAVMIGSHVSMYASNHKYDDVLRPMREQGLTLQGITIENDVWIGTGARILDGVVVAQGSVVAAGAVATKNTEPRSVNAGVPARAISLRCQKMFAAENSSGNNHE